MIHPDIPVKVLENVSETLNDSKFMHSAEVRDLEERWKEKDTIHCKYSLKKKVARIFMGAANQVLTLKLRRQNKRRKFRKRRVK
jgi:hypothetical protein